MILFVLGNGRSGTTLLDIYLRQEFQAFSLGEVNAFYFPYRPHHYGIDCNCGNPNCEFWKGVDRANVWDVYDKAKSLGEALIIDSSKNLRWHKLVSKSASQYNEDIMCILIHKPLKEYFHSIWKRGESLNAAALRYCLYHMRLLGSRIEFTRLNYRDFVEKPKYSLRNIATKANGFYERENNEKVYSHHIFGSDSVRGSNKVRVKSSVQEYEKEFEKEWNNNTRSVSFHIASRIESMLLSQKPLPLYIRSIYRVIWYLYLFQGFIIGSKRL